MPAIITIVGLVFLGTWISAHAIGLAGMSMLPSRARHRAQWLFGHARMVEICCVLVVLGAVAIRLAN